MSLKSMHEVEKQNRLQSEQSIVQDSSLQIIEQQKQLIAGQQKKLGEAQEQTQMLSSEIYRLKDVIKDLRSDNQQKSAMIVSLNEQLAVQDSRLQTSEVQKQQLLLENSTLQKELRLKSQRVVLLNEKIENLQGSDLQLKEAQELKQNAEQQLKQSEQLKREAELSVKAAEKAVAVVKKEYETKNQEADIRLAAAKRIEDEKWKLVTDEINKRTEVIEKHISDKYELPTVISTLYGLLFTFLVGIATEAFRSDFKAFWWEIWTYIVYVAQHVKSGAIWAYSLHDMIGQPIVGAILGVICAAVIVVLIVALGYAAPAFVLLLGADYYYQEFADRWSLFVALGELAVVVALAAQIKSINNLNLIFLFICVHILYLITRWIITQKAKGKI